MRALVVALPPHSRIASVRMAKGVVLERGLPEVEVTDLGGFSHGKRHVMGRAQLWTRRGTTRAGPMTFAFEADLLGEAPTSGQKIPVVARGAQVKVRVITGNVLLSALGTTQEPASLGDPVRVLPEKGGRVLMGVVVDKDTVEVRL